MKQAQWRQYFYQSLTEYYAQSELMALYHWVVEEIYGWGRAQVYLHDAEELTLEKQTVLNKIITRLQNHEPVQYVFQKAYFMDLALYVDKRVLIPRPETEELVALVLNSFEKENELRILDLGTGSGCIPLAIKHERPKWSVQGFDISREALAVARKNASLLELDVSFEEFDMLSHNTLPEVDVVISNPPYIPEMHKQEMDTNVLHHEPHTALFVSDAKPFVFHEEIVKKANDIGCKAVFLETHATEMNQLKDRLKALWSGSLEIVDDLSGKPRFIKALKAN